jgi:hypothetical protein
MVGCQSTSYKFSKTVTIGVGENIPSEYTNYDVRFSKFENGQLLFWESWWIPAKPGSYHIGNHNYLEILNVDEEQAEITARVSHRATASIRDAWAF